MDYDTGKPSRNDAVEGILSPSGGANTADAGTRGNEAEGVAADVDPSVNLARLREIGGGDPELEQRLVGMYLAEADEALTGIKVAIDAQSCRDLFLLAHKLAGSSATFGMSAIYPHLIHLERLGRQGDLGDAARVLSEAHRQLERMRQFLAAHHGQAISRLQQDKQGVT